MTTVDLTLDDELLSIHESTPTAPKAPPAEAASAQCRYCSEIFEGGPVRLVRRGIHEKAKHREEWEAAKKPGAKKPVKKVAKKPATAKTTTTTPGKKRVSAADSIGTNVARIGRVLGSMDAPVGRALVFAAPATGAAADELLAGTYVDRKVVQRFAGVADKWERLGGVIAFPILIALISKNPALYDVLEGDLRDATLDVLIANVPSLEKQAAREKKAVDALRRLGAIDERFATSADPIGLILRDLFAQPDPVEDATSL